MSQTRKHTFGAALINDKGDLLPYTCQSSCHACEEFCEQFFPAWGRMKELGCRIVEVKIEEVESTKTLGETH